MTAKARIKKALDQDQRKPSDFTIRQSFSACDIAFEVTEWSGGGNVEAALIFEEMQNCLQGKYKNVKKKQYPLNDDAKPSFLKVKIIPMQWTSKTKTKAGRFTKIVLDEEPSRLFMNREDGYEQLLQKGKDLYWPNHSNEEYEFNLCNLDGTRWIKTDFEMEHKTLGEIKDVWKRHFYIGMKKKDISANAVPSFPFGACSSAANVDSFSNLPFKLNLDSNPQSLEKQLHIDHHASKKLKTLDIPGVSFTMKDCEFNFSELEKDASSKNEDQTRKKLDTCM
ncbi:unnamed protein product [Ranitomeya imitator]|uniref:CS domain-containing protein n=1 Tax=Ranitomeya imitator TaxID=111125 RepID=A0ABN9KT06_9NEOB|nr:unnamed protein product [Ranitomeya imitator]